MVLAAAGSSGVDEEGIEPSPGLGLGLGLVLGLGLGLLVAILTGSHAITWPPLLSTS